jgi:hypothetical protein
MRYLYSVCLRAEDAPIPAPGSLIIAPALVERWQRQMATPYADLSEEEKASDRAEADRVLALIGPLAAVLAAARAVDGQVDAVAGEEWLDDLSRAVAAYDSVNPPPAPPPAPPTPPGSVP